ncbi:MAG: ABC transporter permease [Alphaproteobacteria bacterium]|nr:MAG: ABC transporter permease [Alphaproteobacteria bacterium]
MKLPSYATPFETFVYYATLVFTGLVLLFLISPIIAIMPLSFNAEPYFSYPMPGLSLRWYDDFFTNERWMSAVKISLLVAALVTVLATALGTLAALGLSRAGLPFKPVILGVLISPMIVPVIITAVAIYLFYAQLGLIATISGLVLAHTVLATPFVVVTVTSTLSGFDHSLSRAASGLGAPPLTVFTNVILPIILPGIISGALFAFVTSFDEVVVALFITSAEQRTLPKQMFSGIREQISPTITAAATVLILFSVTLLIGIELLRRRSERLRGASS